jgi:hypothetical protein
MPALKTFYVKSEAAKRRGEESFRDRLIEALDWEPEEKTKGGRYAATTGEMLMWLREIQPEFVGEIYVVSNARWGHPPAGTVQESA